MAYQRVCLEMGDPIAIFTGFAWWILGVPLWKKQTNLRAAQHIRMGVLCCWSPVISRVPGGHMSIWSPSEQHFSLESGQYLQPSLCKKKQKHPFCFSIGWINHQLSFLSCSLPASGFGLRNLIEKISQSSATAQEFLRREETQIKLRHVDPSCLRALKRSAKPSWPGVCLMENHWFHQFFLVLKMFWHTLW
jgi:hypothetical protein